MDRVLRELERAIAMGDPQAELRLISQLYRIGQLDQLRSSPNPYLRFVGNHLQFDLEHNSTYYPALSPVMNRLVQPYEEEIKQIGEEMFNSGINYFVMERVYDQTDPGPPTWWVSHRNNMNRPLWLSWMFELEAAYKKRGYLTHWEDDSLYVSLPEGIDLEQDAQDILDRYIPLMKMIRGVYRRNTDKDERFAGRTARSDIYARAKFIRLAMRSGKVLSHYVRIAAYLGDPAAIMLVKPWNDQKVPADLLSDTKVSKVLGWGNLSQTLLVKCAIDFAKRAMDIWPTPAPLADKIIKATEQWLVDPIESNKRVISHVVDVVPATLVYDESDYVVLAAADAAMAASGEGLEGPPNNPISESARMASLTALEAVVFVRMRNDPNNEHLDRYPGAVAREKELAWQAQRVIDYLIPID